MPLEFHWNDIDTVLFDMDGTLLDLEFDSYFWQQLVPQTLGQQQHITLEEARHFIQQQYDSVRHTLNWYSLDYWSECLSLDIRQMTSAVGARATLREDTIPFLSALRNSGRRTILLTNAHPHSLSVKIKHTGLDQHLDLLLSAHTFGYPKEDSRLWQSVQKKTGFHRQRALFVDDMEPILDVANQYGIRYCLGVNNPDSSTVEKTFVRYPSMGDFRTLLPALQQAQPSIF